MKKILALTAMVLVTLFGLSGCSTMKLSDYSNLSPEFVLEEYFSGRTVAHGVFENRAGDIVSQFTVTIDGRVEGDMLILDEDFVYKDGKTETRLWKIRILPGGRYEGTTDGVVGIARGERSGNAFNWVYTFDLPVGDTTYRLKFDDWMFLQDDRVMINRAFVTKWGFNVGSVTLSFYKEDAVDAGAVTAQAAAE